MGSFAEFRKNKIIARNNRSRSSEEPLELQKKKRREMEMRGALPNCSCMKKKKKEAKRQKGRKLKGGASLEYVYIDLLPDEVVLMIMGQLDGLGLIAASMVCVRWNALAYDASLWRELCHREQLPKKICDCEWRELFAQHEKRKLKRQSLKEKRLQRAKQERMYRVVLLGDVYSEKGIIPESMFGVVYENFRNEPVIENSYHIPCVVDGVRVVAEVTDTAETDQFTAMRDLYLRSGEGFIIIVGTQSSYGLSCVPEFVEQISRVKDKDPEQIPILLVSNTSRYHCLSPTKEREIPPQSIEDIAAGLNISFLDDIYATTMGSNTSLCFSEIVRLIDEFDEHHYAKLSRSAKLKRIFCLRFAREKPRLD